MSYNTASPNMKKASAPRSQTRQRAKAPQSTGSPQSQVFEGLLQNDRLVNSVTSVLGCTARITGKSGKTFEGVFKTISPEGSFVLGKANQVDEQRQNGVVKNDVFEQFVMNKKDWVRVDFQDVNLEECYLKRDTFKTDAAIGKKMNGQAQKELQKWEGSGDPSLDGALEDSHLESPHSMSNGWSAEEMLNVNAEKFGVKSTFNQSMEEYTTKLVKSDTPEYKEKEKIAAQKAEEIMNESRFERTEFDSGRSEEQLYSSVVRASRSSQANWRERPDRDARVQKPPREGSGSPAQMRKEQVKVVQVEEAPKLQVKEKVTKPVVEAAMESKPEMKLVEGTPDLAKDAKPPQNIVANKPESHAPAREVAETTGGCKPPVVSADIATSGGEKKNRKEEVEELVSFHNNFQLATEPKSTKKTSEEKKILKEQKKDESTSETAEESQQESKGDPDETSTEKKLKSTLNPNAQEFRPVKRNTPSPRSTSTPSSGGAPSPFSAQPPYPMSPYHGGGGGGGMYRPRHRGPRPDYIEAQNYVNATNATGQPFFAQQMGPYMPPPPSGVPGYLPGNIRAHGMPAGQPQPVFMPAGPQQGPIMVPMSQMPPGIYTEPQFLYAHHAPVQMLQSPPQIPSPSMSQSHFSFPATQTVPISNVRPQMPTQPPQQIVLQPQPIIASRPPPPQASSNYQGN